MRKKSRQKAIFSTIAGIGVETSPKRPIPADFPENAELEESQRPPGPQPLVPESVLAKSPEAELPHEASPPAHEAIRPPLPESLAVPTAESVPAAVEELPDTVTQAIAAETPVVLEPARPEPLRKEPIPIVPLKSPEAEVPQWTTPPEQEAARPPMPESAPVPSAESLSSAAMEELPDNFIQASESEPPVFLEPARPETLLEEPLESVPSELPEAEVPKWTIPPEQEAARPLMPESAPVPTPESLSPAAATELPDTLGQATEAEIPLVPEPAGAEILLEEPVSQFFTSIKLGDESLEFGRVLLGNFADLDLAVANEGNGPGILTEIRGLPDTGFSLVDPPRLPLTLGPAESQVLTVRFSPDSVGQKTARLSVVLNGQDGPGPEVRLSGAAARAVTTPHGVYYSPVFNSLNMSLVYIPPGAFVRGSPEGESGRNQDEQQHEVTLSRGFYLQSTPVTQRQWQALMGDVPASSSAGDDYPVEKVSWHECQEFIQKLNLLGEGVYRLPTEAEWEYACRAGGAAALGDRELNVLFCEHDPFVDAVAWYCGNSDRHSHPVALKNPNAWDLYDMHGNVMEWCQDWYGDYPAEGSTDPTGPPTGVGKVIRGGSWFSSAKNCRAAARAKWAPNSRSNYLGFRLVKELG